MITHRGEALSVGHAVLQLTCVRVQRQVAADDALLVLLERLF